LTAPNAALIIVGLLVVIAGTGVYMQEASPSSHLPMPPGLPTNPDATIGVIFVALGVLILASGIVLVAIGNH